MYSVGFVTLSFSVIRLRAIKNDGLSAQAWLKSQAPFDLWSTTEAFTAILCINVPAIVGALAKWYHDRRPEDQSAKNQEYKYYAAEAAKRSGKSASQKSENESVCGQRERLDSGYSVHDRKGSAMV